MTTSPAHPSNIPKWYPRWHGKPWYDGNQEALAWLIDGLARSINFLGAGAFFGTTLVRLAKERVGCPTEPPEGETLIPDCDETLLGIKPSSLLTTYTLIVGLVSSALMPLMGAIIDYTRHRLLFGRFTSTLFCILIFPLIFLNEDNIIAMAIIQLLASFVGWAQTEITHAYLPELTDDELLLNDYTKSFTIASFGGGVAYLLCTIGIVSAAGYGDNDVVTSQVGMAMAFAINVMLLPVAWGKLFKKRDKMHKLPENATLVTAGFRQLYQTAKRIATNYRALKWFYLAIAMSDSGIQTLATISITYSTDKLQFSAQENGVIIAIILIGCVPGAMLSNFTTRKSDPVTSSMLALGVLIVSTALFATFLVGPGQQLEAYSIAFFWGVGTGWKWTVDRLLASTIIPEGQDAELMGFFLFSGQCLSWIPPLVFTAINESGLSQRVGMASLDVYFLLSLVCYCCLGGYKQARTEVGLDTAYENTKTIETKTMERDDEEAKEFDEAAVTLAT